MYEDILTFDPQSCNEAVISEGWELGGLDYLCHIALYIYVRILMFEC